MEREAAASVKKTSGWFSSDNVVVTGGILGGGVEDAS